MRRRLIPILAAAAATVALLVACGTGGTAQAEPAAPDVPATAVFTVDVNGHEVWCVWAEGRYASGRAGGVSCDFHGSAGR